MLKQLVASQAAKTLALCVCPVVTAGVVATKVPQVRRAVHKATAPRLAERPQRRPAALSNVALPPCTPVAPFATLPRVAAALPAAVLPEQPGLVPTAASGPENTGAAYNPGFYAPGAFLPGPGGTLGGGGTGGGGVIIPPGGGGGGVVPPAPPTSGVPEPETWLQVLAGFGVAGGAFRVYRVRRQQARLV
ncbi:MAG TPA: hypothetical protein VL405_07680 [Sphingomonas sp.]|jgi:hypothetical protein|nr:hypothetical protein [Sphingomonas sp.]